MKKILTSIIALVILFTFVSASTYSDCSIYGNCKVVKSSGTTTYSNNTYYNNTYNNYTTAYPINFSKGTTGFINPIYIGNGVYITYSDGGWSFVGGNTIDFDALYMTGNGAGLKNVSTYNATYALYAYNQTTTSTTHYVNATYITGGTITSTNLSDLNYYDDITYNISEGSGANPLTFYMNYTNMTAFSQWIVREYYLGSSSHNIQFEMYDYATASWQSYFAINGQSGQTIITIPVYDSASHIQNGIVQTRLRHIETGISSHRLYIDFSWLVNGNNVGASTNLQGYAQYKFGANNFTGTGNMTASYFFGDGSYLANIPTDNTTIARTGTCGRYQVLQNGTTSGGQCTKYINYSTQLLNPANSATYTYWDSGGNFVLSQGKIISTGGFQGDLQGSATSSGTCTHADTCDNSTWCTTAGYANEAGTAGFAQEAGNLNYNSNYFSYDSEIGAWVTSNNLVIYGKTTHSGGVDPPYVLYDSETMESIRQRAKVEIPTSKAGGLMEYYNSITQRKEAFIPLTNQYVKQVADLKTGDIKWVNFANATGINYNTNVTTKYYWDVITGSVKSMDVADGGIKMPKNMTINQTGDLTGVKP